MPKEHGPWKILETNNIYKDAFVSVTLDDVVRPDTKVGKHVVVEMKAGVCVIPLDVNRIVHLTSEFHYAIGRISLEGVSGGIEAGETPIETARRELREELGFIAGTWRHLATLDPYTTIIRSPVQLFLATELKRDEAAPEGTEQIETISMQLSDALKLVFSGQITHGPTCTALFMADQLTKS